MEKTKEQLETELLVKEKLDQHLEKTDKRYAQKLVERVVWALLAIAFVGLCTYFFAQLGAHSPKIL